MGEFLQVSILFMRSRAHWCEGLYPFGEVIQGIPVIVLKKLTKLQGRYHLQCALLSRW
jgi:hypothetical protein